MFSIAILGSGKVDGSRAEPGERVIAFSLLGGSTLDFASSPPPPEVSVLAITILGGLNIRVRPQQEVKLSGFSLLGARELLPPKGPADDYSMPLDITAFTLLGGVNITRPESEEAGNDD